LSSHISTKIGAGDDYMKSDYRYFFRQIALVLIGLLLVVTPAATEPLRSKSLGDLETAIRDTLSYVFASPATAAWLETRTAASIHTGIAHKDMRDRLKLGIWYAGDIRIDEPAIPPTVLETSNRLFGNYYDAILVERLRQPSGYPLTISLRFRYRTVRTEIDQKQSLLGRWEHDGDEYWLDREVASFNRSFLHEKRTSGEVFAALAARRGSMAFSFHSAFASAEGAVRTESEYRYGDEEPSRQIENEYKRFPWSLSLAGVSFVLRERGSWLEGTFAGFDDRVWMPGSSIPWTGARLLDTFLGGSEKIRGWKGTLVFGRQVSVGYPCLRVKFRCGDSEWHPIDGSITLDGSFRVIGVLLGYARSTPPGWRMGAEAESTVRHSDRSGTLLDGDEFSVESDSVVVRVSVGVEFPVAERLFLRVGSRTTAALWDIVARKQCCGEPGSFWSNEADYRQTVVTAGFGARVGAQTIVDYLVWFDVSHEVQEHYLRVTANW
jgi:hypothetical protein